MYYISRLQASVIGSSGRQGSQEVDIQQIMRDLSDSLERENDLKEQLKYSEEEIVITRKKLTELEEENESLNIQLHKLSSAKTLKFTARKSTDEPEVITEREHEMKLQMELADSEVTFVDLSVKVLLDFSIF